MQLQEPEKAKQVRLQHVSSGRRDWNGLSKVVSQWSRTTQVSMKHRMQEVDWRQFKRKHKKLGYKKKQIKGKWTKATSSEAFKSGKASRKGKKLLVWIKKGRECDSADIIQLKLDGEATDSYVSKEQCRKMLRGKHGMEMSESAKAETFGGSA